MNQLPSAPGMTVPALVSFCGHRVVETVARLCEEELRSGGNEACANVALSQADESRLTAEKALGVLGTAPGSRDWSQSCPTW